VLRDGLFPTHLCREVYQAVFEDEFFEVRSEGGDFLPCPGSLGDGRVAAFAVLPSSGDGMFPSDDFFNPRVVLLDSLLIVRVKALHQLVEFVPGLAEKELGFVLALCVEDAKDELQLGTDLCATLPQVFGFIVDPRDVCLGSSWNGDGARRDEVAGPGGCEEAEEDVDLYVEGARLLCRLAAEDDVVDVVVAGDQAFVSGEARFRVCLYSHDAIGLVERDVKLGERIRGGGSTCTCEVVDQKIT
jgi:hypothetical protein